MTLLVPREVRHSAEFKRTHLGASEIPAALGLSPYERPIEVFERKKGLRPEPPATEATVLGNDIEPMMIAWCARTTGLDIRHNTDTRQHPSLSWSCWTPDGVAVLALAQSKTMGLENQTHREARERWGQAGTGDVPVHVAAQALCEMQGERDIGHMVERNYVPALLAGRGGRTLFVVEYDAELARELMKRAAAFWRLVETNTPPEADASDAFTEYLKRRYNRDGEAWRESAEADDVAAEWLKASAAFDGAEARLEAVKQRALMLIGEAHGLRGEWGSIVHHRHDGKQGFRLPMLREKLQTDCGLTPAQADAMINACTKRGQPYGQLSPYFKKDKTK